MIAYKIKILREELGMSQSNLAKKSGITRSSAKAWEQGISIPSTQHVVELATLFKVSTDFLFGLNISTLYVSGLTDEDIFILYKLINHLRNKNT